MTRWSLAYFPSCTYRELGLQSTLDSVISVELAGPTVHCMFRWSAVDYALRSQRRTTAIEMSGICSYISHGQLHLLLEAHEWLQMSRVPHIVYPQWSLSITGTIYKHP